AARGARPGGLRRVLTIGGDAPRGKGAWLQERIHKSSHFKGHTARQRPAGSPFCERVRSGPVAPVLAYNIETGRGERPGKLRRNIFRVQSKGLRLAFSAP